MIDVVVIGAGISGLVCARELKRFGLRVLIVEKSSGVGGRMATRRLQGTWADHGAQYISIHSEGFGRFISRLSDRGIVKEWTRSVTQLSPEGNQYTNSGWVYPRYCCPLGMTAIAKDLAQDQEIKLSTKITKIGMVGERWQLFSDQAPEITTKAIVSTMPAPQFSPLFQGMFAPESELIKAVRSVKFNPNITVMAGYDQPTPETWRAFRCVDDFVLSWISHDSSKHPDHITQPVFVLQSTSDFATQHLENQNLEQIGRLMLDKAGTYLGSWLANPNWWQLQRWRYALVEEALGVDCLSTRQPLPLVCAGDWCAGKNIEGAYNSGIAAAGAIAELL